MDMERLARQEIFEAAGLQDESVQVATESAVETELKLLRGAFYELKWDPDALIASRGNIIAPVLRRRVPEIAINIDTVNPLDCSPDRPVAVFSDGSRLPIEQITIEEYLKMKSDQVAKSPAGRTVWRGMMKGTTDEYSVAFRGDWDPLVVIAKADGKYAVSTRADAFGTPEESSKFMVELAEDFAGLKVSAAELHKEKHRRLKELGVPTNLPSAKQCKV